MESPLPLKKLAEKTFDKEAERRQRKLSTAGKWKRKCQESDVRGSRRDDRSWFSSPLIYECRTQAGSTQAKADVTSPRAKADVTSPPGAYHAHQQQSKPKPGPHKSTPP